jgi:hypothetical protein
MSRKRMQHELFEARKVQEYEEAVARKKAAASGGTPGQPPAQQQGHGILGFIVKGEAEADSVTGRAGLTLVVEGFRAYQGDVLVRNWLKLKKRNRGYDEVEMVEAFLLLVASGGEHLEDLTVLRDDGGLQQLLARELPSPDAARAFLLTFHDEKLIVAAQKKAEKKDEKSFVPEENPALEGLGRVAGELTRRIADPKISTSATLDHDATCIDSHKQTATVHYKGEKGYQPVVVCWAEQDLVVADEFRDGNVPAAKDNLGLIKHAFHSLPPWVTEMNFRADSACYDVEVLKWLADPNRCDGPEATIGFTISADMTKDLAAVCRRVAEPELEVGPDVAQWKLLDDSRLHEKVEWAEVEFTPGVWPKHAWPLRYVAVRFSKRQGQLFASGERFKHLAVVSNRTEPGDELVRWHWKKAGTIEHVHDEIKNGLGGGVLPCWEFGANAAWFRLNTMAYNLLTAIKHHSLPCEHQRVKVKRLRFLVFDVVARLTWHARYLYAHIKQAAIDRGGLVAGRAAFLALLRSAAAAAAG